MVDVTGKQVTVRTAEASGAVLMSEATRELVTGRRLDKGDALEVARIAGIMAAKRTADLIPLCHPLSLGAVDVTIGESGSGFQIRAIVRTAERTGVEMEALTAVSVAALTIYDMVKSTERGVSISDIHLVSKSGGRSGDYRSDG